MYGATKAALNAYLESLRNRIERRGAFVVTIKPGPVDTPMTQGLKMPGMISAEQAAAEILLAAKDRSSRGLRSRQMEADYGRHPRHPRPDLQMAQHLSDNSAPGSFGTSGRVGDVFLRPELMSTARLTPMAFARSLRQARRTGHSVGLRGAGRSYGDASLNAEGITLDLTRMKRILAWDPQTGVITVEPGVTIQQLWQYTIEDGWWPNVVSGTMFPTLGGAAAMNIHGKNNWKVGPIGDHIQEFEILLPTGETKLCSRSQNAELFHAAIGGFGMLGVITRLTLHLKKVHSGLLKIEAAQPPEL